jgi:hypothetical protein
MFRLPGKTVFRMHGGSAPQVQAAARRRLQQATDALAAKLLGIALDDGTSESVRLQAIRPTNPPTTAMTTGRVPRRSDE